MSPSQTMDHFQRLCAFNTAYQPIDWLRYAVHHETDVGLCWTIKQETSRIELHVRDNEALLLLWVENETPPPMDNIKPQWDTTPMVQAVLAKIESFPNAIAWAPNLANEWETIWLGTQWWPMEGITDAVDSPQQWLYWWWNSIMEFTTPPPGLYDDPIVHDTFKQ